MVVEIQYCKRRDHLDFNVVPDRLPAAAWRASLSRDHAFALSLFLSLETSTPQKRPQIGNWSRIMAAIGSLVFCTDCGNLLDGSAGKQNAILTCQVCGAQCKGMDFCMFAVDKSERSQHLKYRHLLQDHCHTLKTYGVPLGFTRKALRSTNDKRSRHADTCSN
jgi:DNA-directed RNA polymerase subunit M/transcription elongation factor TFIIS